MLFGLKLRSDAMTLNVPNLKFFKWQDNFNADVFIESVYENFKNINHFERYRLILLLI